MIKHLFAVIFAAGLATVAQAESYVGDTMNIQYRSTGHLQIEIAGPRALVDRAKGVPSMPAGGCGYTLSWGDNTTVTPSTDRAPYCKIDLKHTYAAPGRYVIKSSVAAPKDPSADANGQLHGTLAVILN